MRKIALLGATGSIGRQSLDVIEQLGGEENEIYTFKMTYNNEGANGHPNLEAHYAAADELVSFIKDKKLLY